MPILVKRYLPSQNEHGQDNLLESIAIVRKHNETYYDGKLCDDDVIDMNHSVH